MKREKTRYCSIPALASRLRQPRSPAGAALLTRNVAIAIKQDIAGIKICLMSPLNSCLQYGQ
jgi:hypothetical protein